MEYGKRRRDLLESVRSAFAGSGLRPYVAERGLTAADLWAKVSERILNTTFGLYDITEANQSVMMELGFALGARRRAYVTCMGDPRLPPIVAARDSIRYVDYKELVSKLREFVRKRESRLLRVSWTEPFDTLPFSDILEKAIVTYQAEELLGKLARDARDHLALNGRARYARQSGMRDHMVYGPYRALPRPGSYIVFFRLRASPVTDDVPIVYLDVCGGGLGYRALQSVDFVDGAYSHFAVPVQVFRREEMEYRVLAVSDDREIWVDCISVVPMDRLKR